MSTIKMKYKIENNKEYGRFLIAVDDIKEGEIIFTDLPIVVGPKTKSDLVCFNCNKPILKQFKCCNACKVAPLCEITCINGYHSELECKLFSNFKGQLTFPRLIEDLNIVTVIRCLLLRHKEENEDWMQFINLESHYKEKKDSASMETYKRSAKLLQDLKVVKEDNEDLELVKKICCILDVNSFEIRLGLEQSSNSNSDSICGIYPLASSMAHSCVANTHLGIDNTFKMVVRASVPIPQNTPIFFCYSNLLEGTIKRREHVRESKHFQCKCYRCKDPTELGIHMSTFKCKHCKNGLIIMVKPLKCTKLSKDDKWYCTHCQRKYSKEEINSILKEVLELFFHIDNTDPKSVEEFLAAVESKLHPNHYIVLEAKHQLAGLLREILNRAPHPLKKMMQRKLEICMDFIPILNVLEPGISRLKGITLYELHIPTMQLANKDHEAKEITTSEYVDKLIEAEGYLKEAIRHLLYEPMSTPEGKLCRRAMEELRMLQKAKEHAIIINEAPNIVIGPRIVKNRKK